MNRDDVIDVLSVVAAATRRTVGDLDVKIWQSVIGGDDKKLAIEAVGDHLRDSPGVWLEPGHVHQRVRAKVREELEHESNEERSARQEALAAKVAEDVEELANRKALPAGELKIRRREHNPLSVACPWCRADVHASCVIPGSGEKLSSYHPSRVDAARDAS